jgi:hypothetical protein
MLPEEARSILTAVTQREAARIEKYGHVRAPIAKKYAGQTVVAVGSRLLFHPNWKTFHDFLFCYIGAVFEKDWFAAELGQALEERHPLMQWYDVWFRFYAEHRGDVAEGEINRIDEPPAQISALLSFAYDLYTLEHHGLLPRRLVDRLKRKDQFQGARYEAYVAAAFVRAGFRIGLEDESDLCSSHCEFSAAHSATDSKYAVEAKSRHRAGFLGQAGQPKPFAEIEADLRRLLVPALRKQANYDRIVFIDINVPPSERPTPQSERFSKVALQLKRVEENPQGSGLPPAFVFITNWPYHFVERDEPLRGSAAVFTGFNMPDFRPSPSANSTLPTKFPAIFALHDSILRHTHVPHDLE